MKDCANIGPRIRAARIRQKLTQEKLGQIIGVGTTHISHIETGSTLPSMDTFVRILNALGCSADELLEGK
jgi:transcriptional regulator with XRE-family HTH domain